MAKETRSRVEIRAFEIWEREGRPHGKAMEHWYQAVAEVAREDAEAAATKLKKTGGRKKAEKAKPAARAKKTASASTTKKPPKSPGKKAASTAKAEAAKKLKKTPK